jgi:hypothetical protein
MPRLWKHRPSPAMIVAMLALFVSMGGTGYAVSKLPKRSVGPAQLRKNAVRAEHIKRGSITTAKLAVSTLTSLRSPVAAPAVAGGSSAAAAGSTTPDRVAYADKAGIADRATLADRAKLADRATLADEAAAANTAAVADYAKLADNASKLGGKSVAEFLTSDTIRWITPFTIGETTREGPNSEGQKILEVGPFTLTARCTIDETIDNVPGQDQADIIISTSQDRSAFDGEDLLGSFDKNKNVEARQFVNTAAAAHGAAKFEASSDGVAIGGDGVLYIKGSYLFAGVNINGQAGKCKFGGYVFL